MAFLDSGIWVCQVLIAVGLDEDRNDLEQDGEETVIKAKRMADQFPMQFVVS